jgi:hypothetical protein
MSKLVLICCAALAVVAPAGLRAQTAPTVPPQGDKPVTGTVATVTATGCLERWVPPPPAPGSDTTADKGPAGVEYVLTRVEGQAASATGGTGEPKKTGPETRYLLMSGPSLNLAPHLNHTVKIAGSIAPQPSEGASPEQQIVEPSSRETNLPAGPTSEAYKDNLVVVTSLTMVSKSCSR